MFGTSTHFNNFNNTQEQNLIEDLVLESIRIYGIDITYCARTLQEEGYDALYTESPKEYFNQADDVEMYIVNVEGFAGEGDLLGRFGLEIRDQMTLAVGRRSFASAVGTPQNIDRPQEGDLIFLPLNTKCFQIKHVEHEPVFYQMGALQFYTLSVELFEYAGQRLNTGVSEIDSIETEFSTDIYVDVQLTLEDGLTAIFTEGNERILSEEEDRSDSSATAAKDFDTITDSENIYIESEADAIVDFSDADPFSEGGTF